MYFKSSFDAILNLQTKFHFNLFLFLICHRQNGKHFSTILTTAETRFGFNIIQTMNISFCNAQRISQGTKPEGRKPLPEFKVTKQFTGIPVSRLSDRPQINEALVLWKIKKFPLNSSRQ